MAMHLVNRNVRNMPWTTEETLAPVRRQSSIDRVIGPRMSKSSSPSKVLDSRILRGYCGAKGSGCPGPFRIISPRAQLRRKTSPNKGTSVERQLWEQGERTIVGELVTSALNARSWQSGRINEGMTLEQCHANHYHLQQVEGSAG